MNDAQFGGGQFSVAMMLAYAVYLGILFAGLWRTYEKAGHPGWAAIVPIYNIYVLFKIAGKPWWYLLLFVIPLVNLFAICSFYNGVSKAFGKNAGFTLGLILLPPIFYAILGFGDARFVGADGRGSLPGGGNGSGSGSGNLSSEDSAVRRGGQGGGVVW
jgi:hypothetical protein